MTSSATACAIFRGSATVGFQVSTIAEWQILETLLCIDGRACLERTRIRLRAWPPVHALC